MEENSVKKRKITMTLTRAEANQLVTLLIDNVRSGEYYGNRDQWCTRSAHLLRLFAKELYPEQLDLPAVKVDNK